MNFLKDIITYVRRIIKSPSDAVISDALIIDYINRFWVMDVDARIQLFDLKTKYQFQTTPGQDQYNMPLYNVQSETPGDPSSQDIGMYPVYQGFTGNCLINGFPITFSTRRDEFFGNWFTSTLGPQFLASGDGSVGPYTLSFPILSNNIPPPQNPPFNAILRGHVDIAGIIATGDNIDPPLADTTLADTQIPAVPTTSVYSSVYITSIGSDGQNIVVADSGQFLDTDISYGLLMTPGKAPYGNAVLPNGYSTSLNTINYFTGVANVTFPVPIPEGQNIYGQCYFFQTGLPRSVLFYNNILTFRVPPAMQYLVEIDAYLTPAAFFNTAAAIPYGYMAEYIARGAARKILSDTGDVEQFNFYEPLFREQEMLVWKRAQRQFTSTRTQNIFSGGSSYAGNTFGWNSSITGG